MHSELAAYHEAAHAVVALHDGRVVKEVRISHHLPGNGWVKWVRTRFPDAPDGRNPRDALLYWTHVLFEVEREVKILLSGFLAEAKLLRTPLRSLGARSDLQRALAAQEFLDNLRELLRDTIFIPGDQTAHFLERMGRQTRRLIAQPWCWNAITVLAKDVMDWHRLSGHDAAETIQWSMKPRRQLSLSLWDRRSDWSEDAATRHSRDNGLVKIKITSPPLIYGWILVMNSHSRSIKSFIFFAGLSGITSCAQDAPQTLVTIADARVHAAKVIDIGEAGDSVGDILTFDQPLLDEQGKQIGNNSGTCIRTRVGHSFQCQWTLTLENGSILVAGREFDKGTSHIAIVGGTGQYAGITGRMESVNNGDGTFTQTLHYWIRY